MSDSSRKRLIVVVGPTGVGKTKLAIQLASYFNTEIISADSRQLYREMTIGTAKPSGKEQAKIRHHFVGQIPVSQPYDAGQYGEAALTLIHDLFKQFDSLILCGGSGMYVKAILEGFDEMPRVEQQVRTQIIEEYQQKGLAWLQETVGANDPDFFDVVDKKNPQRLMRALELIRATGRKASEFRKNEKRVHPFSVVKLGLERDREELYLRIDQRVDTMIKNGLLEEARDLYPMRELNALQTVGYQEWFDHFDGKYDFEEAIRLLKRNTRRYAKRQLTWFKKDDEINWFHPDDSKSMIAYIDGQ